MKIEENAGFSKTEKETGVEFFRTGRLARTAMAALLLLAGAVDRISAQTQGTGAEKDGSKKEQISKEMKFPTSLMMEKVATEKIFDECRKLREAMNNEVKNMENVFADKNATSMQMLDALSELQGPYHKLDMTALKASVVLSDAQMKEIDHLESLSAEEMRTFKNWSKPLFEEWQAIESEIRKVGNVIMEKESVMQKKGTEELEKIRKDIDNMFETPSVQPPPSEKNINA